MTTTMRNYMPAVDPFAEPLRILVLDGGDLRVVSQMVILEEIMSRAAWDRKEDSILPSNYFHMIAGSGAGGLLAILLGVLCMTVEMAMEEFVGIYGLLFDNDDIDPTPSTRAETLEKWMENLLAEKKISQEESLLGSGTCPTFVCSTSVSNLNICRKLRNYRTRTTSMNVSIVDAVRATWASPGIFTSVFAGSSNFPEEFVGGDCVFSNPTKEVIQEAYEYFGPVRRVSSVISLGCSVPKLASFNQNSENSRAWLAQTVVFFDTDRVAMELKTQLEDAGVYHRYALRATQDALYSLRTDSTTSIVGEARDYIDTIDSELNGCITEPPEHAHITIEDIYRRYVPLFKKAKTDGLPLLSPYFIICRDVMEEINAAFHRSDDGGMKVLVIIGMAGSGKTQSISKFMRVHQERFSLVLCIDASSAETIEAALITKARKYSWGSVPTFSRALEVIGYPGWAGGRWAIIYDGVNDPNLDIARYMPRCNEGTIIITTRNQNLQLLSPSGCVTLDAMPVNDATALLLKTALPNMSNYSSSDKKYARVIVEELGCLAIAVTQAGCHIQMQGDMESYLGRLRNARSTILRRPIGAQRVEGHRSVYAALDVMLPSLTPRALDMLSTLCFLGSTAIPLEVLFRASRCEFANEPAQLLPRLPDYTEIVQLLRGIFIPMTTPEGEGVWTLLDELQRYSLVKQARSDGTISLQFHNLVFAWAKDRLSGDENSKYQSLAIRLLACCTTEEDEDLFESLFAGVQILSPVWDVVHVNDRIGFSNVVRHYGKAGDLQRIRENVHKEVLRVNGPEHLQTSEAALYLADAHRVNGHPGLAAELESEVVNFRIRVLGRDQNETMDALAHQALGFFKQRRLREAESLQREVLRFRDRNCHIDTTRYLRAIEDLAQTLAAESRDSTEASDLAKRAIDQWIDKYGPKYWRALKLQKRHRLGPYSSRQPARAPPRPPFYFEECTEVLGRSVDYLFAAKALGAARWSDLLTEQLQRQLAYDQHLKDIASFALDCYRYDDQEPLAVLLKTLAWDMRARLYGSIDEETLAILEELDTIPALETDYRNEVTGWASRHKPFTVTIDFVEAGPKTAPRYMCIYTLDSTIECIGEWKPKKLLAQESAAKEAFKALQRWDTM